MSFIGAGRGDFLAYWIYGKTIISGANPYDAASVRLVIHTLGIEHNIPPLYVAPHGLTLFSLFALFDLETARKLWFITNIIFISLIVMKLCQPSSMKKELSKYLILFTVTLVFMPLYLNLFLGQLAIFLAFVFYFSLELVREKRFLVAGFLMSLLTIKPHLFSLFS